MTPMPTPIPNRQRGAPRQCTLFGVLPILNRCRGFTLLEVSVVACLMAALALLLSSAWRNMGGTAVDLVGRSQLVQERDLAIEALSRDLGGNVASPDRTGGKRQGQWLEWDRPANVEQPLNADLRLLYDGRTDPSASIEWASPNTIIRYIVESSTLVRWNELANTKFTVPKTSTE